MAQCSIIDLSPPTPPRIGFNPPSVGGFFFDKISASVQLQGEGHVALAGRWRAVRTLRALEMQGSGYTR